MGMEIAILPLLCCLSVCFGPTFPFPSISLSPCGYCTKVCNVHWHYLYPPYIVIFISHPHPTTPTPSFQTPPHHQPTLCWGTLLSWEAERKPQIWDGIKQTLASTSIPGMWRSSMQRRIRSSTTMCPQCPLWCCAISTRLQGSGLPCTCRPTVLLGTVISLLQLLPNLLVCFYSQSFPPLPLRVCSILFFILFRIHIFPISKVPLVRCFAQQPAT